MKNRVDKKYDIGVVIGRFQVASLTDGHKVLIQEVIKNHNRVVILVGVSVTLGTRSNPLDYISRRGLFDEFYTKDCKIEIVPILDTPDDTDWSKSVERIVRSIFPIGSVCLYGGRDSFIKSYSPTGVFDTHELDIIPDSVGTDIRKELAETAINSEEFRRGAIYASTNNFAKVYTTVDVAIIKENTVLMGNKIGHKDLHFIGGFVDPTDLSFEDAALRELHEEVVLEVDNSKIKYIGSTQIQDWRYKKEEKVITSFYTVPYIFGTPVPKEPEFNKFKWVTLNKSELYSINHAHKGLFNILLRETGNG